MKAEKKKRQGSLVILSLGLGDLVFSLPVIEALKADSPSEPFFFLTHRRNSEFLSLVPGIDRIVTYENAKNPLEVFSLVKNLRRLRLRRAFILNPLLQGSLLAWLAGIPERIGYRRDYEGKQSLLGFEKTLLTYAYDPRPEKMHETERYLDLLRLFGMKVSGTHPVPRLNLDASLRKANDPIWGLGNGPRVAINLGTAWPMRRWPVERLAACGKWLQSAYDARIVLVGVSEDKVLGETVLRQMERHAVNAAGAFSLPELAVFLKQADLFISNDTGTMHLAAALDVPMIALFGPGDPEKVRPLSENAKVLKHPIFCSPCRFQYTNRCQNNLCMQSITLEEVEKTAREILKDFPFKDAPEEKTLPPFLMTQRKKILYLQSTAEIGGTDITLLRTLEQLDKNRFEPYVLLPCEGPFAGDYRRAGAQVHLFAGMRKLTSRRGSLFVLQYLLNYFPAVFWIAAFIHREKIDLVHTNTIHNLYGFLSAFLAGRPHVWHIREIVMQSSWVRAVEVFLVRKFSTRFIVMDNAIGEAFTNKRRGFPAHIAKIYDGVDLQTFHPRISGARIRSELGLDSNAPLVGMVTRLDPWKGIELFLEAAQKIHHQRPETRFLVCGGEIEGHHGYESRLKEKAARLGIQEAVFFTGWTYKSSDIPEIYAALDVSVQCPIYPEPYGLANVEAMASGVPIVSSQEGGPSELCMQNETALLVPPKDPDKVAQAVLSLLRDPMRRKGMGEAGRQRAERLFDSKRLIRDLENLYEEIWKSK